LNSLQTASLLVVVTSALLVASAVMFAASASLTAVAAERLRDVETRASPPAPPAVLPEPSPGSVGSAPAVRTVKTLVPGLRLREGPTTTAPVLATLASATPLQLLEEAPSIDDFSWAHVRTDDGTEGWVIASAIE
jgi:hypothetical protein